jgi:hypothetical protein
MRREMISAAIIGAAITLIVHDCRGPKPTCSQWETDPVTFGPVYRGESPCTARQIDPASLGAE